MLTPRMGMLRSPASRAALSMVPSPPKTRSTSALFAKLSFLIAPLFTEKNRRRRVQNHVDASSPEPTNHILQRTLDLRKLRLCQNPDTLVFH